MSLFRRRRRFSERAQRIDQARQAVSGDGGEGVEWDAEFGEVSSKSGLGVSYKGQVRFCECDDERPSSQRLREERKFARYTLEVLDGIATVIDPFKGRRYLEWDGWP